MTEEWEWDREIMSCTQKRQKGMPMTRRGLVGRTEGMNDNVLHFYSLFRFGHADVVYLLLHFQSIYHYPSQK